MSVVKSSEQWMAGARFLFRRNADADTGTVYPYKDLGSIKDCTPNLAVTEATAEDSDGGVVKVIDREVSKVEMTVTGTCINFNPDNLAFIFYGKSADAFTQLSEKDGCLENAGYNGGLVKLFGYDSNSTPVYNIASIQGVVSLPTMQTLTVTTIVSGTKTFTTSTNHGLAVGAKIVLTRTGLANAANAGLYTVATAPTTTTITVTETVAANETAVSVKLFGPTGVATGTVLTAGDAVNGYEVVSLPRGLIKVGTAVFSPEPGGIAIAYTKAAMSGKRKIDILSAGTIRGKGILIYGRGNNARQTAVEFDCTLTATNVSISATEFSTWQFSASVLGDVSGVNNGRILEFYGALPDGF